MALLWVIAAVSFCVSVVSTVLVARLLDHRIAILGSFAGLLRTYNSGVAFSVHFPPIVQSLLILAALVLVLYLAHRSARSMLNGLGFGLIIGGALGNLIDRIPDGLVTDFIQVGTFPVFNVADACITVGVVLLLVEMVMRRKS